MGKQQQPADDKEQLRELIREGHEVIKDLGILLRELRHARAMLPVTAEQLMESATNAHMNEVDNALNEATAHIQKVIRNQEEQTRRHYSELLGADTANLILRTCAMVLHLTYPKITVDGFLERIMLEGLEHKRTGCSCLGCMTIAAAATDTGGEPFPGRPGYVTGHCGHAVAGSEWKAGYHTCEQCAPDIIVTTADMIDDVQKRNPGRIVIDMR